MAKKTDNNMVTPKGRILYPNVFEPKLNYNEDGYEYTARLILGQEEAEPLIDKLNEMAEEKKQEAIDNASSKQKAAQIKKFTQQMPFEAVVDEETEEETGEYVFKFKQASEITSKKTGKKIELRVTVFDANLKPVTKPVAIGNDSICRVKFEPSPYVVPGTKAYGVTLRLKALQIVKLEEYVPGGADASGFDAEDEGFDASAYSTGDEEDAGEGFSADAEEGEGGEEEGDF
jgi:hypothetical protein